MGCAQHFGGVSRVQATLPVGFNTGAALLSLLVPWRRARFGEQVYLVNGSELPT